MLKPPLKWVGGKTWSLPWVEAIWREYKHLRSCASQGAVGGQGLEFIPCDCLRLVEPFCGGLSVALHLAPHTAVLNDINEHLIHFYTHLQLGLQMDIEMRAEDYDAHRDWLNALISSGEGTSKEAAQLFYYLNRFGFNGLCRFNRAGQFNVPSGGAGRTVPEDFDPEAYRAFFAERNWTFTHGDFARVPLHERDFIYADPPYDDGFTAYSSAGFDWAAQQRVATHYRAHPGPVILTNRATPRILELYRDLKYHTLTVAAPRRVGGDRKPVLEVIAATFPIDGRGIIDAQLVT